MNERIKELAEQAETWNADGDKCEVDLEKFAELIVRECANVVNDNYSHGSSVVYKILFEHFGVKE